MDIKLHKDGKEDVVYIYSGPYGVHTYTSLANGDGTFANLVGGKISSPTLGGFGGIDSYKKMFTDLNGDGNKDIIFAYDDSYIISYIFIAHYQMAMALLMKLKLV